MDLDGSRESESMSMDIDDGAVFGHHPHHCDSVKMNSPDPSGERVPSDCHPRKRQFAGSVQTPTHCAPSHPPSDCRRPSGSNDFPQFMIPPPPPSPVNHPGEMGDVNPNHVLPRQRRCTLLRLEPCLEPSVQEATSRKRKHTHDSSHTHIMDHDHTLDRDVFTDDATSQPPRRIRPRLWTQLDREFSPLLYMSPGQERDSFWEETISAFHYPPNVTDSSRSIQRYFYPGNPREQDPCTSQSSSSPQTNDQEGHKERKRSDSANSLAEVALASTVTSKYSRLSTLQDFWLPRPFEETEQQPSVGIIKVHERGLEAGPSFLSAHGGRTSGREPASGLPTDTLGQSIRECGIHACSSPSAMPALEPTSTNFFDKPICDSPDPIDTTDEDRLAHVEGPYP